MPLKHLGFFDFPFKRNDSFSVTNIFAHTSILIRFLLNLPTWQGWPLKVKGLLGRYLKNKPASSAMKMLSEGKSCNKFGRFLIHWPHWLLSTTLLSPQIFLNTISFLPLTLSNHPLLADKLSIRSLLANSWAIAFNQWPAY